MDNLLEIIGTLVFVGIYFFGNMISKKNDSEDRPAKPRRQLTPVEDPDTMERQRRVQDEIRRKIMERRGQTASQAEPMREEAPVARPITMPPPVMQREVEKSSDSGTFSWDESDDSYDSAMERQLKQIEATKREAAQLQSQTSKTNLGGIGSLGETSQRRKRRGAIFSGSVRSSLQDPAAARAAFIYGEVLGPPVSLRKSTGVPGLTA